MDSWRYLLLLVDLETGVGRVIYWPDGGFPPPPPPDPETIQIEGVSAGSSMDGAVPTVDEKALISGDSPGESMDFGSVGTDVKQLISGVSEGESLDSGGIFVGTKVQIIGTSFGLSHDSGGASPLQPGDLPQADKAAFPGAEDWGADALTGLTPDQRRNGEVLFVTNLNSSGAGSFRQALLNSRNDRLSIIVFRVGGYILSDGDHILLQGKRFLYIAGQTAPGGGIHIRGSLRIRSDPRDIVIRYMTLRARTSGPAYALDCRAGQRLVVDHCSGSFSQQMTFVCSRGEVSWSTDINRVSYQRLLLYESGRTTNIGFGTTSMDSDGNTIGKSERTSLHHSVLASCSHRNPNNTNQIARVANNVVYNWRQAASHCGKNIQIDYHKNYYKMGPMGRANRNFEICYDTNNFHPNTSIYLEGNVGPHNQDPNADVFAQWSGPNQVLTCYHSCGGNFSSGDVIPTSLRRTSPMPFDGKTPVTLHNPFDVYQNQVVVGDVGNNRRLNADGSWTVRRDSADARILQEIQNGTGLSAPLVHEDQVGGFPSVSGGTPYLDSNNDGIPDVWATNHLPVGKKAFDIAAGGFTYIEHFLNGTIP